jgi:uncharacterized protein (DUF1810 family)
MSAAAESLSRFLDAQAPVYAQVVRELAAARKTSHWVWFIFPQIRGLGRTSTARFYGIATRAEAVAYWQHPVLGGRLKECAELVLAAPIGLTSHDIFGMPDDLKLRSSMTLFAAVAPDVPVFGNVLARFYAGKPDGATLALLV